MTTFDIKRNDLQPYLYVTMQSSTGTAIDLTGATIVATMKDIESGTLKINRQSAGVTATSASTGAVQYEWQSGDTDTTGNYHFEFEVTPASGGKFTLPTRKSLVVNIIADEDAT